VSPKLSSQLLYAKAPTVDSCAQLSASPAHPLSQPLSLDYGLVSAPTLRLCAKRLASTVSGAFPLAVDCAHAREYRVLGSQWAWHTAAPERLACVKTIQDLSFDRRMFFQDARFCVCAPPAHPVPSSAYPLDLRVCAPYPCSSTPTVTHTLAGTCGFPSLHPSPPYAQSAWTTPPLRRCAPFQTSPPLISLYTRGLTLITKCHVLWLPGSNFRTQYWLPWAVLDLFACAATPAGSVYC